MLLVDDEGCGAGSAGCEHPRSCDGESERVCIGGYCVDIGVCMKRRCIVSVFCSPRIGGVLCEAVCVLRF